MLDIRLFRENPEDLKKVLGKRNGMFPVEEIASLDFERRGILTRTDELKAERNRGSKEVAEIKRGGGDAASIMEKMRSLGDEIRENDAKILELDSRIQSMLLEIPNLPHSSVPVGEDESANVEIHSFGLPPVFEFEPRPHWEIGEE
ncbi:MAG TPA: serine--tRNA ligase, partial [Synergistetes bacterium]|nr:serine--tRNA ligase [Synergistota bacterium]